MSHTPDSSDFDSSPSERLASMARETVDRVASEARRTEDELRAAAASTVDAAKRLQKDAAEATEEHLHKARSYIASNPLAMAGVAFAAGALLGALFLRR